MVIAEGLGVENGPAAALHRIARRLRQQARRTCALPPLFLFTDETRLPDPVGVAQSLPAGCGILFRHYGCANRWSLARELSAVARARRLVLFIAGDGALAAAIRADGLHMPEGRVQELTRWRRQFRYLTAACHSERALVAAGRAGADAAFLSPVFPTASHPDAEGLGVWRFARLAHEAALPVYALGGVGPGNACRLLGAGATGLGAIGAFTG